MITRAITASQIRLASDIANEFFPNIKGDTYRDDASWLAILRAMLPPRLGNDVSAQIRVVNKETKSFKSRASRVEYYLDGVDLASPYSVTVVNVQKTTEDFGKVVDALKHNGVPDHALDEPLTARFADADNKSFLMPFVNHENANVIVFVTNLSMHMWHVTAGFMRRYFVKLFEQHPITDREMAIIRAVSSSNREDNSTDDFIQLMEQCAEPYDFRSAMIRRSLGDFATKTKKARIKSVERQIKQCNDNINSHRESLAKEFANRENAQIELLGLTHSTEHDEASQELTNFFMNNKSLVFSGDGSGYFNYWVKSYLTYWSDRTAESYIKTRGGYLYEGARHKNLDMDKFEKLLRAIFLDRTVKILICAAYRFTFTDNKISIDINSSDTQPAELNGYMLNPHPMHNNCWGTGYDNLVECLNNCDYAGAVGVTTYAASELNISDISTAQFSRWLAESKWNCIQLPDGTRMTCEQYLATL